jgi:hypothetical protein
MKYRWLVVMALGGAAAVWIAQALLGDAARSNFFFVAVLLAKATALAGAIVAASSFKRGDYLRRAWLFVAGDYVFILSKDLLFGSHVFVSGQEVWFGQGIHLPGIDPRSAMAGDLRALFIFIANGLAVAGAVMLARAWRIAGLELPGSQAKQRAIIAAVVIVSVAVVGYGGWTDLSDFLHVHQVGALGAFLSDVGDLLSFCLIAPVLLTAWALRGGKLMWPWALFTVAQLAWMLFDAAATFGGFLHLGGQLRGITETLRALACLLGLGSGMAQRWAVARRT